MVLNYDKFKESLEEINFIPFKLREELDPSFVWDKETEERAYHHYKIQDKEPLSSNIIYLKEMKRRLIGKNICFYAYSYKDCKISKLHGTVKDLNYNASGILCIHLDTKESKGALDERKPIKNYIYKHRPDIDPYGEDDWED